MVRVIIMRSAVFQTALLTKVNTTRERPWMK